jgi:UDPglucose 6-dehydrogenase
MSVSIIGLGKLGASMAAAFADSGLDVIGVDVNQKSVDAINAGLAPVQETDLAETIAKNKDRIRATMSHEEAVHQSDVSFVIVPTPSDEKGAFSLQYAQWAFAEIGKALKTKEGYHVIVLTSTVLPGSTRHGLLPFLEKESGKKCGKDFGLCYSPEFIALGSVIRDLTNADFYLLGQFDDASGDAAAKIYSQVSKNNAPIQRMDIENAELAKISLNSFVTLKISFANMLSAFCERIPGGNVDVVSDAIGLDRRVGRAYLTGGLGFGGPCFPRDNVALGFMGEKLDVACPLLSVNDAYNRDLSERVVSELKLKLREGATVAVLGLAYKPLSHVIEESPGIMMCEALSNSGFRVIGYDPLASEGASSVLKYKALVSDSLEGALGSAEVVIVMTTDEEFKQLDADSLLSGNERIQLVDCWRCMSPAVAADPRIEYIPLGRCLDDATAAGSLEKLWS